MFEKVATILLKIIITSLILSTFIFAAIYVYSCFSINDMTLKQISFVGELLKGFGAYTIVGWLIIVSAVCLLNLWVDD